MTKSLPIALILLFVSAVADAAIVDSTQYKNVAYLVDPGNRRILRYNVNRQRRLQPITFSYPYTPKFVEVSAAGVFVAFDRAVYRYALDGSSETHVSNTANSISDIQLLGQYLVVMYGDNYRVVDSGSLDPTDAGDIFYGCQGASAAPSIRRVFCRSTGVSPSDIVFRKIDTSGVLVNEGDSPYHGDYPGASKTWVFPDQTRVADDAGIVYDTASLEYLGSLAGSFDEMVFVGDMPVVRRGRQLIAFSNGLRETGVFELPKTPDAIGATADGVVAFFQTTSTYNAQTIALSDFAARPTAMRIDPTGMAYTPDAYALDADDGILYLLSKQYANIFRWSLTERRYLASIGLVGAPRYMAMDTDDNVIYLANEDGMILRLDAETLDLSHLSTLPQAPLGLALAGRLIFSADGSGAWASHYTIDPDSGTIFSSVDWNYVSDEYVWNAFNSKMYFFRDDTSPNDLLWEDIDPVTGVIGTKEDSPYHSSEGILHPIHISPDGGLVLLGSGRIYDSLSLQLVNSLSSTHIDAAWVGGELYTLEQSESAYIQQWSATLAPAGRLPIYGEPLAIFDDNGDLLLVRSVAGVPVISTDPSEFDGDRDDDGIPDEQDAFPDDASEYIDFDGDGLGDTADPDDDGDGVPDARDAFPLLATESKDGDGDGIGDNSDGIPGENAAAYFPLIDGEEWSLNSTSGNHVSRVLAGTTLINGIPTKAIVNDLGQTSYVTNDAPGIRRHRVAEPGWQETYAPPIRMGGSSIAVGDTSSGTSTAAVVSSDYGSFTLSLSYNWEVVGKSAVTVPAGTFQAYKVAGQVRATGYVWGQYVDQTVSETYWAAKGIGLVKTRQTVDGRTEEELLVSTTLDDDQDTIADTFDNCRNTGNRKQLDSDGDGWGDACDADDDGDGVTDGNDNCRLVFNPHQANTDGDSLGNACDEDDDNDGIGDTDDAFPRDPTEWRDSDADGMGDNADPDDDQDGMSDEFETRFGLDPFDPSDASIDSDGDGESNLAESVSGTDPFDPSSNYRSQVGGVQTIIELLLSE